MKKILLGLAIACLGVSAQSNAQVWSQNFLGTTPPALPTSWTSTLTAIPGSPAIGWKTTTAAEDFYFASVPNVAPHTEYAVVNDNIDSGNTLATLVTPVFSLVGITSPYFMYDYFFLGAYYTGPSDQEKAWVDISINGGTTWTLLDSMNAISSTWNTHSISLAAYSTATTVKIRFCYSDANRWNSGAAIGNPKVFSASPNDIALTTIAPVTGASAAYGLGGSNITMTGTVFNNGTTAISSYTINYVFNGGATVSNVITGTIAPFTSASFTDPTAVTLPVAVGGYPIKMWVSLTGDANASNDSSSVNTLTSVSFMPTKKLMIEEATGTWCGYCVRGIVYMDSLRSLYGSGVSLVAVHNGDPMVVAPYDTWMGTKISGYPSVVVDRQFVDDPSNLLSIYNNHHNDFGFANLSMSATVSGSTVTVPVSVNPAVAMASGDYRLILVLTEDNVHSTVTGGTWDQHNYYSGGSIGALNVGGSAGYDFVTLPSVIPATTMYYNHVNRSLTPSALGVAGYVPGTMTAGTTYTHTFTGAITTGAAPTGWSPLNMHAVVMLINGVNGNVLNSQNVPLRYPVGISNVSAGVENLNLYPNPATSQVSIQMEMKDNNNVTLDIVDMSGKVVYAAPTQELTVGNQVITISTANFAVGVYNVRIQTNTGVVTERLTIMK